MFYALHNSLICKIGLETLAGGASLPTSTNDAWQRFASRKNLSLQDW
jgi:hypothetical protein